MQVKKCAYSGIDNAEIGAYAARMDMNEAVAKAVGAERTIADMTVRKLAEEAGIPERSLMRILQAEREINVNQIEKLARAFKLYPHEIIEHAETILERAERTTPDMSNVTQVSFGQSDNVSGSSDTEVSEKKVAHPPIKPGDGELVDE